MTEYVDNIKIDSEIRELDKQQIFITKDSGQRQQFPTGAQRDIQENKGRYDLISPIALKRLAQLYERGAVKYGIDNWKKGIPLRRYLDSAMRHLVSCLNGETDEDHALSVCWNIFSFVHTIELIQQDKLPKELDDLGWFDS